MIAEVGAWWIRHAFATADAHAGSSDRILVYHMPIEKGLTYGQGI